jgi:hypothetical protein
MINHSSNTSNTNNYLSSQIIEHKDHEAYADRSPGPGLTGKTS